MPGAALPLWHQVQHVLALRRLAVILALLAGERDLQLREHWHSSHRVPDLEEPGVETGPSNKKIKKKIKKI